MMHYIDEVGDMSGQKVLLRLDLNTPVADGKVLDPFRLEKAIETIDFLRSKNAQVIVVAHCENSISQENNAEPSLLPMWQYLNGYFPIDFSPTYFTPEAIEKLLEMKDGGVLMFENIRINEGEKTNDSNFVKQLAAMADIYVNDAFSVCHRKHASIIGVPAVLPHYGGLLMKKEIEHISEAFNPERPFVFILGGAKFDTKLPLITKYLDRADYVFVGGALANNFFKSQGYEIGRSLCADGDFGEKEMLQNSKLLLPVDVTVQALDGSVSFKKPDEVIEGDLIVDSGPETIAQLEISIRNARMVVWNGPLGNYEIGFADKTEMLAEAIAESGVRSVVGGGDTLASIQKLGIEEKFSFISTGGGAMLDFLVNETLPGIEALTR